MSLLKKLLDSYLTLPTSEGEDSCRIQEDSCAISSQDHRAQARGEQFRAGGRPCVFFWVRDALWVRILQWFCVMFLVKTHIALLSVFLGWEKREKMVVFFESAFVASKQVQRWQIL